MAKQEFDVFDLNKIDFSLDIEAIRRTCPTAEMKEYSRALGNHKNRLAGAKHLYGEGDSWFDFPYIIVLHRESDLLDSLIHHFDYCVDRDAMRGDTVAKMSTCENIDFIEYRLESLTPDAFLFSGSSNDMFGLRDDGTNMLYDILNKKGSNEPIKCALLSEFLDEVKVGITKIVDLAVQRNIPTILHAYGNAIPSGIPAVYKLKGPWILPQFKKRGYEDDTERRTILCKITEVWNDEIHDLACSLGDLVHYVDLRPAIKECHWHDELHLHWFGWRAAAGELHKVIKAVTQR